MFWRSDVTCITFHVISRHITLRKSTSFHCFTNFSACSKQASLVCRGCTEQPASTLRISVHTGDGTSLEIVDRFCYFCHMLITDGDADPAVEATVWKGCNKFRKPVPLLTNKDVSLLMRWMFVMQRFCAKLNVTWQWNLILRWHFSGPRCRWLGGCQVSK